VSGPAERLRVLRIITRLNIGGPAQHVLFLASGLKEDVETVLVTGTPDPAEGSMDDLAGDLGVIPLRLPHLKRQLAPLDDLRALWSLWRLCRRLKPDIVHTHTSKAGLLGRLAARLAGVPVVLHTFHGHVFHGYFGPWASRLAVLAERGMGALSTRLYAVSPSQREELLSLGIAPPGKIITLPLGLDLDPLAPPLPRGALRRELGLGEDALLVGCVARLAPIKAHADLLEAFARIAAGHPAAHLLLIGDGEERPGIEQAVLERGLGSRVHLLGWRRDLPALYGDLDLAVLSSKNEGLPVALIEAAAAGVPIVATRVGGVTDLLAGHPATLVPPGNPEALAGALSAALGNLTRLKVLAIPASGDFRKAYGRARMLEDLRKEYLTLTRPGRK
jgi:glycosyltransferase involved in cell wall biosynthesis